MESLENSEILFKIFANINLDTAEISVKVEYFGGRNSQLYLTWIITVRMWNISFYDFQIYRQIKG